MKKEKIYVAKTERATDKTRHVDELNFGEKEYKSMKDAIKQLEVWAEQENDSLDIPYIKKGGVDFQGDFKYWVEIKEVQSSENIRKKTSGYIIRDREAGNIIDTFKTLKDAEKALEKFELSDKKEGIYEPNFYEIAEIRKV